MKNTNVNRDSDKFMLRFPEGMRDRIAETAKANNRSMNAEIVGRLERSFEAESLGFNKDLLDVFALQATLTATFCRTLDWSLLDPHQTTVLEMLSDVSERSIAKLHFNDTRANEVVTKGKEEEES